MEKAKGQKRYNLYYIFKEDYEKQKIPPDHLKIISEKFFEYFFQKSKTEPNFDSS